MIDSDSSLVQVADVKQVLDPVLGPRYYMECVTVKVLNPLLMISLQ